MHHRRGSSCKSIRSCSRRGGAFFSKRVLTGKKPGALGLFAGLKMELPAAGTKAEPKDSWVIIMGGSGNVGQLACQLASLSGYKVLASCSPSKASVPFPC